MAIAVTAARRLAGAAALLVIAIAVGAFARRRAPAVATAAATSAGSHERAPLRVDWPAGVAFDYAFALESEDAARVAGAAPMTVTIDLAGDLRLRSFGERGGEIALGASFVAIRRVKVDVNGRPAYSDDDASKAALIGSEALLSVDRRGTVRAIGVGPASSDLFRHLVRAVLLAMNVTVSDGAEWNADENAVAGVARAHYTRDPSAALAVRRRRESYETLTSAIGARFGEAEQRPRVDANATFRWEDSGALASVRSAEAISAPTSSERFTFEADLTARAPFQASTPPPWSLTPVDRAAASGALAEKLRAQRIEGLTLSRMMSDLNVFAATGTLVEQPRWVWRATGLLESEPAGADALVRFCDSPGATADARAMAMDLLASVGHAKAQAAMRAIVASPSARDESALPQLVQRFGFLAWPEVESVALLEAMRERATKDGDHALSGAIGYTLGAMARHLHEQAQDARAAEIHDALRTELASARDADDVKVALAALGNAAYDDDAPQIAAHAADADEQVRSQVAWSLRTMDAPLVRRALIELAGDALTAPQTSALKTLAAMAVDDQDFDRLEQLVRAGRVKPVSYAALLDLLPPRSRHARAIAAMLLARNDADGRVVARLYELTAR